jgi:hypothetical protein
MLELWKRLRHFGTSIMLVASLAFAFHSAAVAADISGAIGCNGHVHTTATHDHVAAHEHAGVAHTHIGVAQSHSHQHAASDSGKQDGTTYKRECKVPCCGSACTTALLVAPSMPQIVRGRPPSVLAPHRQAIHEAQPSGLKRPPKPLLTV